MAIKNNNNKPLKTLSRKFSGDKKTLMSNQDTTSRGDSKGSRSVRISFMTTKQRKSEIEQYVHNNRLPSQASFLENCILEHGDKITKQDIEDYEKNTGKRTVSVSFSTTSDFKEQADYRAWELYLKLSTFVDLCAMLYLNK